MSFGKPYTEKEKEWLRILFEQKKSDEEISAIMGRTVRSVADQRRKLRLKRLTISEVAHMKSKKWTKYEIDFICNYWKEKSDTWMARKLGVTYGVYKKKRLELGFRKPEKLKRGIRKTWTYAEEEFMKEHYPTHNAKDIARHLKRHSAQGVIEKAKKLGLRKAYSPGCRGFADIDLRDPYYK